MSTPTGSEAEGLLDGVVQLHFEDEAGALHDLSAAEMAEVLQGMVEFTSQMAKAGLFGEVVAPEVRVRAPKEGSVLLETLIHFTQSEPWTAAGVYASAGVAVGAKLGGAVTVAARVLRGNQVSDFDYINDGRDVKITWSDTTVDEISAEAWGELKTQKKKTKKALSKIMAPLGDDVTSLGIRSAGAGETTDDVLATEPNVVFDVADYREAVAVVPDPEDEVSIFEIEAMLASVDFREGKGWRVEFQQGTRRTQRSVEVEDRAFLRSLDQGRPLHKNDILNVKIREVVKGRNGRKTTDWAIIEVLSQRRGGGEDEDDREGAGRQEAA